LPHTATIRLPQARISLRVSPMPSTTSRPRSTLRKDPRAEDSLHTTTIRFHQTRLITNTSVSRTALKLVQA